MKQLIKFFLNRSLLVNIILIIIFCLAIVSVKNTNRNKFPEVELGIMTVTTKYPGASPKDVEQNVTRVIEEELKSVSGISNLKSVSAENVSSITIEIDINYSNQQEVKDEIRRAVDRVNTLPIEVTDKPVVNDLKSSELPVIVVGISGDVQYRDLRNTAKIVERDIRRIKGVSKIDKYGYRDMEFEIELDPGKLKRYYVALNDVLYALGNRNIRATGGNLESYKTQRNILTLSQFEEIDDVKNVIIRSALGGGLTRIKDVGIVKDGFEDEKMRTVFDGRRGISLVVKKSSSADIIEVVDRIKKYLKKKQKRFTGRN